MSLPLSYIDLPITSDKVPAIIVHNSTDARPRFEATEISPDDPIFNKFDTYNNRPCTIPSLLGIPIIARRLSRAVETAHQSSFTNPEAIMLFQNLDIRAREAGDPDCFSAQGFGETDAFWHDARSFLLVREDGGSLLELHVQALIAFARDVVFEAVKEYQRRRRADECQEGRREWEGLGEEERMRRRREDRRALVLEECRREKFEEFFRSYI